MGTTVFARGALLLVPGIVCILLLTPVRAAEQTLSLPRVIEYSLQHNGELKSLRQEQGISDAGKVRAGLLPNPILELEGGTGALTGSSAENSLSLGVSQEFLLGGKRQKRLTMAELESAMYRWQLADRERLLGEEVKSAFYELVLAQARSELAERAIALNRQLLEVTRERLAAGDIPELEMNLVQVELARSQGVSIDVARARQQNQAKLLTLMGLPPGEEAAISGTFAADITLTKTVAELKRLALEQRPDLQLLAAANEKGAAEILLAQADGVPNLTAGLAVRRETTAMEVGGIEGKDTAYTIGLKLSLPLPLFDRNQAGVQEARAKRQSSESRLLAATSNIEREVETAYASLLNTEKVLSLYRVSIFPQLDENLKLTQEAYRLGELGILAVIQEQKKYFEVSDSYLSALHDRQAALVKLESAVAIDLSGGVQ